jgi:hypothetical protein
MERREVEATSERMGEIGGSELGVEREETTYTLHV